MPEKLNQPVQIIGDDPKDPIEVDATITHRSTDAVEITKFPVEKGQSPTDHARLMPPKFTMEGLFTNTKGTEPHPPGKAGPAQTAESRLLIMLSAMQPLTVATDSTTYVDMMMTSLDIVRDQKTGDAVRFTAAFEGVVFVNSETTVFKAKPVDPKKPVAMKDQGKKQPIPVEAGSTLESTAIKTVTNYIGFTKPGSGVMQP